MTAESTDHRSADLRIVLVEPAGPRNVGSVARVMANFDLSELVLVNPQCDPLGPEARQMAVHAVALLEQARIVDSLGEAIADCQRTAAATGADYSLPVALETPRELMPWLAGVSGPTALVFGREDRGLDRTELEQVQRLLRIPSSDRYSSLNLAQAVGICCYELAAARPGLRPEAIALADQQQQRQYFDDLELLLRRIGFLHPHTAAARMEKLKRLAGRAELRAEELAMLRGMVSQITWAIAHPERIDPSVR